MASLGAALPLAIAGTVVAVGGGVSGGAAAVRHAAAQTGIARRVRKHFNDSLRLLESVVDQLAASLLTQAKLSVRRHRDRHLGSRVCRLLSWLIFEVRSCRKLHARLLAEAGVPDDRVAQIDAARRADQLLALVVGAHEFVVERLADDFVGRIGQSVEQPDGILRHRLGGTEGRVEEAADGDQARFRRGRSVAEE
uniref:Secreted protein n=1 Tax=Macrostomum lignano TaxID=282301 RepID=A0A1I8FXF8_9PLAT